MKRFLDKDSGRTTVVDYNDPSIGSRMRTTLTYDANGRHVNTATVRLRALESWELRIAAKMNESKRVSSRASPASSSTQSSSKS